MEFTRATTSVSPDWREARGRAVMAPLPQACGPCTRQVTETRNPLRTATSSSREKHSPACTTRSDSCPASSSSVRASATRPYGWHGEPARSTRWTCGIGRAARVVCSKRIGHARRTGSHSARPTKSCRRSEAKEAVRTESRRCAGFSPSSVEIFGCGSARASWRRVWSLLAHAPRERTTRDPSQAQSAWPTSGRWCSSCQGCGGGDPP